MWEGGDPECDHRVKHGKVQGNPAFNEGRLSPTETALQGDYKEICPKCGAKRTDQQLGSEKSPDCLGWATKHPCGECFVCHLVEVFRGVRRVLRDDGTCWVNLGDAYSGGTSHKATDEWQGTDGLFSEKIGQFTSEGKHGIVPLKSGLPSGNLVGVPWRVALALQADGWVLRQDVIWHKVAPMPESVQNRCTKSHEYLFLFAKSMRYYYDAEAIKEKGTGDPNDNGQRKTAGEKIRESQGELVRTRPVGRTCGNTGGNRNKRSVWRISSEPYPGSHFATFPKALVRPCVLAGTSERGCCSDCGTPWRRVVLRGGGTTGKGSWFQGQETEVSGRNRSPFKDAVGPSDSDYFSKTVGWEPSCECHGRFETRRVVVKGQAISDGNAGGVPNNWDVGKHSHSTTAYNTEGNHSDKAGQREKAEKAAEEERTVTVREYVCSCGVRWAGEGRRESDPCDCYADRIVPCVVLDPFVGSGTAVCVALDHGRYGWGIDLSEDYLRKNAVPRVEGQLLSKPATAHLVPRATKLIKTFGEGDD